MQRLILILILSALLLSCNDETTRGGFSSSSSILISILSENQEDLLDPSIVGGYLEEDVVTFHSLNDDWIASFFTSIGKLPNDSLYRLRVPLSLDVNYDFVSYIQWSENDADTLSLHLTRVDTPDGIVEVYVTRVWLNGTEIPDSGENTFLINLVK